MHWDDSEEHAIGNDCFPIAADVRNYKEMESAFEQAHKRFGRIDIVVCGAAGNFLAPAEKLTANGFKVNIIHSSS